MLMRRMISGLPRRAFGNGLLASVFACLAGWAFAAPAPKGSEGFQTSATTAIISEDVMKSSSDG